jgi:hypothetical protein
VFNWSVRNRLRHEWFLNEEGLVWQNSAGIRLVLTVLGNGDEE